MSFIIKNVKNFSLLSICVWCLLSTSTGYTQFSVSERTYKKLTKVEKLLEQKKHQDAMSVLEKLESSTKNRKYELALVYQAMGHIYYDTNRTNQAIRYFEKSLKLNASPLPVLQGVRLNLVQLHAASNSYRKATEYFENWLQEESNPSGDVLALGGSLYAHIKQYGPAVKYLKQAITTTEKPRESWHQTLLSIYYEQTDYRSASGLLQKLVSLKPDNKQYWIQLSSTYYLMKDNQKALSILELAYTKNLLDKEDEITNLIKLYLYLGVPIKAAKVIDTEFNAKRLTKNKDTLTLLASAYLQSQEIEQSAETYLELGQLTNDSEFYLRAARLFLQSREWNKVVRTVDRIDKNLNKGQFHILKGMALVELKEFDKALQAFHEAKQQPDTRASANQWLEFLNTQNQIR